MKRFGCFGLLLFMPWALLATDALQFAPQFPYPGVGGQTTNGAGFAFRGRSHLLITALLFNPTANVRGVNTTRVDVVNATGQILASAIISTNSPFTRTAYRETIPPLVIPGGTTNFIRNYFWGGSHTNIPGFWMGGSVPVDQGTIAPELDYLGCGHGLDLGSYTTEYLIMGGNFQFSVIPSVTLQITPTSSNYVQLSWRADAGDYVLHSQPALDAQMTPVAQLPELIGLDRVVTVPIQSSNKFFRLVR
jgi:hypothetical protein